MHPEAWPALPYEAWQETCTTLQLMTQIVGKIRLAQTPWVNHSWHVTLYVTPRGLTTSAIPYGERTFQLDFDFVDHALVIATDDGGEKRLPLAARPVADFHDQLMAALAELEIRVRIHGSPNEVANPIPFRADREHSAYDPEYAQRFWRVLVQADRVFKQFRTGFLGKVSPVHFFWGSFDHAVTRFSGRRAPLARRRRPQSARCGHARGLLARGEQCRLLAGRRCHRLSGILLLRLPRTRRLRHRAGPAAGGVLPSGDGRVHPAL